MRYLLATLLIASLVPAARAEKVAPQQRTIDLAICLDTSNSMDGLIDAARTRIWTIVNDLALAKPTPRLRVALLAYGNSGFVAETGWVKVITTFTEDLDLVSQKLFALKTNGGTEYVGRVLQAARNQLQWQQDKSALKLIVVAGNETADQDRLVPYRDQCKKAIAEGIMVNAIYCGSPTDSIAPGWSAIAKLSDGQFAAIDQNNGTVNIATPFDARLAELSVTLNGTYLPIGISGKKKQARQAEEDANAAKSGGWTAAQRGQAKGSSLYYNSWDVVDALARKKIDLATVKDEDLPECMRGKTLEEKQKIVDEMRTKRESIQKQIQELGKQRQAFVAAEMKKRAKDDSQAFDAAVRKALRAQAEAKGYKFEE